MSWFKWFQAKGGEEPWNLILADQEERTVREKKPAFTTILAADNDFKSEMTSEDHAKVHYRGDFYVDFDASSLDEVIPQFQAFLKKLRDEHEFDLNQARLYASGGKGFHVIIPQQCFIPKISPKGYAFLPGIYREMAMELFVDTLDLRVYTARRGRMFRTANVERPDKPGVHKVPIEVAEAFSITPERYRELCAAPRNVPPPAAPELNAGLALLWASASDKVDKAAKTKKKSKLDANLLKKFGGDFPPSIQSLMKGENIQDGIGFQRIAMQLALAAHSLGKSEDVFLDLCEGLCQNHSSDGTRYNTPVKRRNELRRMYQYMKDNVCYDFSVGGVKSLMTEEMDTKDLDYGGVEVEEEEEVHDVDFSITMGMKVTAHGIYKKTQEEGLVKVCSIGMSDPRVLLDTQSGENIGYEVECHLGGQSLGTRILTMDTFLSRQKFMQFTLSTGGASVSATDAQVGALADILRTRAHKSGNVVYTTPREGLDVTVLQDGTVDTVWADRHGVVSREGVPYRLRSGWTKSTKGEYKSDLRMSPTLEPGEAVDEFFTHLFEVNEQSQVAKLLGWYLACFLSQPIRYIRRQFPMLQVYGAAEAGKSKTSELMGALHFWRTPVLIHSASGQTKFQLEALLTGSGSIPLILDEFKPREMRKDVLERLKQMIRGNYVGEMIGKGVVERETGQSVLETRGFVNVAPIVSLGEALESQTAILHRTVLVNLTAESRRGREDHFHHCYSNREHMSALGRSCIDLAIGMKFDKLGKTLAEFEKQVREAVGGSVGNSDRQIFNMAVVLTGLEFGKVVMKKAIGDKFTTHWSALQESILDQGIKLLPKAMSEAAKVLAVLVHLSQIKDENDRNRLTLGEDYLPEGDHVHLNMRNCYTKYARYQSSISDEKLYDNVEAFIAAMSSYSGVINRNPVDSALKFSPTTLVYVFDAEVLLSESVGEFHVS